jgi:hypothetical protein
MIQETIAELEARLQKAGSVDPQSKAELLRLIDLLKREIAQPLEPAEESSEDLPEPGLEDPKTAEERQAELSMLSLEELSDSVSRFEKTHPQLVHVVNRICQTLSNIGI